MILKLKKLNFTSIKVLFLEHVDIQNVLLSSKISVAKKETKNILLVIVSNKISSAKKTINTLLFTCMIVRFNCYIYCFQKQDYM